MVCPNGYIRAGAPAGRGMSGPRWHVRMNQHRGKQGSTMQRSKWVYVFDVIDLLTVALWKSSGEATQVKR